MRETHHTPVEGRFNLDIPMPHVHMTIPEMETMCLAPDEYGLDEGDDLQLVYFGNTTHATYHPTNGHYNLVIGNREFMFRGSDVVMMCNMIQEYLDDEGVFIDHLNRFTWTWANTVANNLDHDRFYAEAEFLFKKEGTDVGNMAGEGDEMFQFHVNEYQIFGLRTPEDDYRVMRWDDKLEPEHIGDFPTMVACRTAIQKREIQKEIALATATVIDTLKKN